MTADVLVDECGVRSIDPERVAATRRALVGVDEVEALAEVFKLLGDPKRARILFALLEAGELCVCDLAATVEMSETSVSQAMRLLRSGGVVRNRREGRIVYYRLDDDHVCALLELSRAHVAHAGQD